MPRVSTARLEEKRQLILHAAIACFARDGFHKTTMSDIAAMAGISDGLAYRYFSGKDEIIREVARWSGGTGLLATREAVDSDDAFSMLELLLRSSFERFDMEGRGTTLRLRFRSWAEALDDEAIREEIVARWERHAAVGERLWAKAQREGRVAPDLDPQALSRVMLALHDGLDLQWSLDESLDIDKCNEVVLAIFQGRLWAGPDGDRAAPAEEKGG